MVLVRLQVFFLNFISNDKNVLSRFVLVFNLILVNSENVSRGSNHIICLYL